MMALVLAAYAVGIPLVLTAGLGRVAFDWARTFVDPARAARVEAALAPDLLHARGLARVRGRARGLVPLASPWDGAPILGYAARAWRSPQCLCMDHCPHGPTRWVVDRRAGLFVVEDDTAILRIDGELALELDGARAILREGDLVELTGLVETDPDPRRLEDAPDRVRRAALVMRSATAGPILARVLTPRDATPSR